MAMERRSCPYCKTYFDVWASIPKVCCSLTCAGRLRMEQERLGLRPHVIRRAKTGVEQLCKVCGKNFYRKMFQIVAGTGVLCSRKCQQIWQARNSITKSCEWCGLDFVCSPDVAKRRKYCSWACQSVGRIKNALPRLHNGKPVILDTQGYVRIYEPDNPGCYDDGWIMEHRWVIEQSIGRRLERQEHVHHVNGNKEDNCIENLVLLSCSDHQSITQKNNVIKRAAFRAELAEYRRRFGPLE